MMMKRLEVSQLTGVRNNLRLFPPVSFTLKSGEALLVSGPNGVGKSSFLRWLSGLATPETGEIKWQGQVIAAIQTAYWENLHYVGHENGIKLGLTVVENIHYLQALSLCQLQLKIETILSILQLNAQKNTPARYLSAGQKRRLSLAKLILMPKSLWILDEPFTALDDDTHQIFLAYLDTHLAQNGLAIISSHHPIILKQAVLKTVQLTPC